jgi:hypothetical protein
MYVYAYIYVYVNTHMYLFSRKIGPKCFITSILLISMSAFFSFIHMCIQCLGHFSPTQFIFIPFLETPYLVAYSIPLYGCAIMYLTNSHLLSMCVTSNVFLL